MSNKRPVILMAILLVSLAGYFTQAWWNPGVASAEGGKPPLLPGKNALTGLRASQDAQGEWFAEYDYFYNGAPGVQIAVETLDSPSAPTSATYSPGHNLHVDARLERGAHHARVPIPRPLNSSATSTGAIEARMTSWQPAAILVSQRIEQRIDWLDWQTLSFDKEVSAQSDDIVVNSAVRLIDQGDRESLEHARQLLERVLARNPMEDAAYVELARVAMKTNWGPEGLHQAESLIKSALQIHPSSVDARILLSYVESHQKRYADAEALFEALDKENPRNLWLWWNWGEMLQAQGKSALASQKYRQTLAHPVSHDTYDRAREAAYESLLRQLDAASDRDGMDALYRQRLVDYGGTGCGAAAYARFLVIERGDTAAAIATARQALRAQCGDGDLPPRSILGMAYYLAWATSKTQDGDTNLGQAHIYLPVSAGSLYLLAANDRTLPAARALLKQGEAIDQRDNQKLDALAIALSQRDVATARRLLSLGARPDALVSENEIPVAFIPVLTEDTASIKLMQQSGIDYAKLRVGGATAAEQARRSGHAAIADLLDRKAQSL